MDLVVSETNKGKKALLYEGFTYRIDFVLKSEDISWRCTKRGCFVEDLMSDMAADPRCSLFADYILKNYVASNSKFPPNLWAQLPSLDSKRTTNAAESFHAHYNEKFYAAHPTIFAFLDVITKIQIITTYIKIRTLHQPAVGRRSEMDKLTFLMEKYAKYQNGERNRHQYIKAIGFKYSVRTDV